MALMKRFIDMSDPAVPHTRWRIVLLQRAFTSQDLNVRHSYEPVMTWDV
jgi:hypothetical protein